MGLTRRIVVWVLLSFIINFGVTLLSIMFNVNKCIILHTPFIISTLFTPFMISTFILTHFMISTFILTIFMIYTLLILAFIWLVKFMIIVAFGMIKCF